MRNNSELRPEESIASVVCGRISQGGRGRGPRGPEQMSCLRLPPCIVEGTMGPVLTAESLLSCETEDMFRGHLGPPAGPWEL